MATECTSFSVCFFKLCFPIHRPWLLGPSWKMPSITPVSTSKGPLVNSRPRLRKKRRPTKVSAAHVAADWPCVGTPGDSGLVPHSSWPLLFVWADDTGTSITKIGLLPSRSTAALIEEPKEELTEVEDPWELPELKKKGIKWSGKNEAGWRQKGLSSPSLWYHCRTFRCSDALWRKTLPGVVAQCSWRLRIKAWSDWGIV